MFRKIEYIQQNGTSRQGHIYQGYNSPFYWKSPPLFEKKHLNILKNPPPYFKESTSLF